MSKELTVNNITFNYPTSGDDPGWGGPATDWATEVTTVLNNVTAPDDILQIAFNVVNAQGDTTDQSGAADIVGLQFNGASVRSATVDYAIYRVSDRSDLSATATAGDPTVITSTSHGLETGNSITVFNSTTTPDIDGTYTVTVIDEDSFSIDVLTTVDGDAPWFSTIKKSEAESGKLYIVYDNVAGFSMGQGDVVGDAGVRLSIDGTGQVQYTSTDAGSLNYVGTMKFSAKTLQQ